MAQKSILSFFTSPKAKAKPPPETPDSNSKSPDKKDESNTADDSKSCPPEDIAEEIAEEQVDKNIEEETLKSEETPSETNLESGKNKEAAVVTIIPLRKTARKQFSNRRKKPKSDVHPLQDHFKGKTPEPVSKTPVKVSKIVLSVPKWEAETGSLKLGTENVENAINDNNRVNHPQSYSSNEDTKESEKRKVKKSTPKIRASLTDKNAKKPRKRQAKNISNQLESESPDKGTKIPEKCQAGDTDDKLKSESPDKEAEKPEECQAEDTGDQLESEPPEEEAKKPGKRQAEDTDDRFKSNSPDKEAKKSKKLHTKDFDDKLQSESPHKAVERSKKRKAKSYVRKIESDSSDEDMRPHETNSAKSLQPDSSDEDAELPIVRKRVKRNVITDDSPLKMAAPTPKVVVENYGTKLDKFIMKPRKSRDTESVTVSALLKSEGEEEKMDVSELQNQSFEVEVRTPSSAKKSKDKTKLKGKNGSEEETQDPEKPDKKPIVNAFDVLKKKGRMPNNTSQSRNDDTEEKSTNNDSEEKTTNNDTKETNTKKGSTTSTYCPSKNNYHPIEDASWKKGETVPYLALARTLEEIDNTSGRLKMIEILANYFRSVIVLSPDDLLQSVYLCLNRLAPEYHNIELGVGETLLMKALAQATGRTLDKIKADVTNKGDLGLVAENSRGNQRVMFAFPKLTVPSVFIKFKEIAEMSGNSVMAKKTSKIQALFSACRECEAKYIIRSLSGKLRIGLAEQSVLSALSQAITITPPGQDYPPDTLNSSSSMSKDSFKKHLDSNTLILKSTYCQCPNYDMIIPILLKDGLAELPNCCQLTPGIPLKPMLAHPASSLEEVLRRFDGSEFTCEFKYDGERAQIHKLENDDIKIYSRNQEDNTSKYPDIIARFSKALAPDTKSCILDAEVVAWDKDAQQIQPFQVLSTRKRKDAADSEITVQVCIQAFDLLYVNGEALVKKPLRERRNLLRKCFEEVPNEFSFVKSMDGNSTDVMQEFLEESIKGSCEGLMVKALDVSSTYEIDKRSHNWLKLKKDYLDGVGDTLDLVVIGGWFGKGKRTGNYGGFLLACYDNETEEFQTICKIGTGFKDEDLEVHAKFFKEHTIEAARSYYRYDAPMEPDQWFDACQVWEVKCADLSISPVHKAACGIVDPVKGISLRFPRFLRIRDDKKAEDATTSVQVASMYNNQEQVRNQAPKDSKADDLDFY